jgi:putative ABC transport system permease protein
MTAWQRKILRDLWRERLRTALVVLAIALGIAAFSGVLSAYAILTRELNRGYLATNPASATVFLDRVDDALLRAVAAQPGVAEVEARRSLRGRIKAGPGEWKGLQLFVVRDYADVRISRLVPQRGAWPPATGEMLVERDALQVVDGRIGQQVRVRTSGGSERTLRVSGTVADVGQAQARMEQVVYGYMTLATLAELGEEPYLDQLKLVAAGDRMDETHVREVVEAVRGFVENRGARVRRVDVPKPGQHPHADLMGLLLLLMAAFGFFALTLSGVLVVNLLTALLASQVRQIGVMKAIGGSDARIAALYLAQALLLGGAAFVLAIPAGLWGGRALSRYLAVFLNFDLASLAVPAWVFALSALVGLVVPVVAAARPVLRGVAVTVREALADHEVRAPGFGVSAFDRALAGVGGPSRPLLLSLRNGFRRRTRLALTIATLATAGVFFMSAFNAKTSFARTIDRLLAARKSDLSVALAQMAPLAQVEQAIRQTPGVKAYEGWIVTEASPAGAQDTEAGAAEPQPPRPHGAQARTPHAATASGPHGTGSERDRFTVMALPAETRMLAPEIVKGRWLQPGDTDALVANDRLASRLPGFEPGSVIKLAMGPAEVTWRVVGLAREPFSPSLAYVPLAFFESHGHGGTTNSLRLVLDDAAPSAMPAAKERLDDSLDAVGVRALSSTSRYEGRRGFDEHMLMIDVFLLVMALVLGAVGGLGLTTTMSLNVLERRREMGVLRAIGASPVTVWRIVLLEGTLISLMSGILAALLAWPVSRALGDLLVMLMLRTRLDFVFEPLGVFGWLAISITLGAVASFVPAWQASRRPVREALAHE